MSRTLDIMVLASVGGLIIWGAEHGVRLFYPAPPGLVAPQVRFQHSLDRGWEMVPDDRAHSFSEAAPINGEGRRDPPPAAGAVRLAGFPAAADSAAGWLVLGGSTAFGTGVDASLVFHHLAARAATDRLKIPVEVVNGGCEGYDPYQSLAVLRQIGRKSAPRAIILVIEPEDLPPGGRRDRVFSRERFARREKALNRRAEASPSRYEELKSGSRLIHFLDGRLRGFIRMGRDVAQGPPPKAAAGIRPIDILVGRDTPALEAAWKTLAFELDELEKSARWLGAAAYVVAMPLPPQVRKIWPRARYQTRLAALCRERGFVFVDPLDDMRAAAKRKERLYLPRLPYLSRDGHRAVAHSLIRHMEASPPGLRR